MTRDDSAAGKTILVVSDGKRGPSATQRISFEQPFATTDAEDNVRIAFAGDPKDGEAVSRSFAEHGPDLLILSRYTSVRGSDWISMARVAGIPVIFHIDDDLLAVPSSLGAAKHSAYNSPERLRALRTNIDNSDLVYASTRALAKRLLEHGVTTPIVAGDIYCSVAPEEVGALIAPATGPVVGYMGTGGHSADLAMILPAICDVMEAVPSLQFEVFGTIDKPPQLSRFGRRVRHLSPVADYSEFIPYLRSLGWWIGLAPLEDNPFNRCKADTKWVEYSLAGMAVIASDLPVYERACAGNAGILASTNDDWSVALLTLLHRPDLRHEMIETSQQRLRQSYTHEILHKQVMDIVSKAICTGHVMPPSRRPPEPASVGAGPPPSS